MIYFADFLVAGFFATVDFLTAGFVDVFFAVFEVDLATGFIGAVFVGAGVNFTPAFLAIACS